MGFTVRKKTLLKNHTMLILMKFQRQSRLFLKNLHSRKTRKVFLQGNKDSKNYENFTLWKNICRDKFTIRKKTLLKNHTMGILMKFQRQSKLFLKNLNARKTRKIILQGNKDSKNYENFTLWKNICRDKFTIRK